MTSKRPSTRLSRLRDRVLRTEIRNRAELVAYVTRTTAICVAVALCVDIVNQLAFFIAWDPTIRSWLVTVAVVLVIAVPVSYSMARAHLELYRAKVEIDEVSRRDPLTGLLNRRALLEDAGTPSALALVIVDIDRFKRVNDTYGHLVGDAVLCAVATLMEEELRGLGRVGRLGGEEFALIAFESSPATLLNRLWDLRDRIALTPIVTDAFEVNVTISGGMATRAAGQSFADLYSAADRALYMAKAAGRNRIVVAPVFGADECEPAEAGPGRHWRDVPLPESAVK